MKLNLGCGDRKRLPGFINVDIARGENIDIVCDVKRLPMILDDSVKEIYASHILEYFDKYEVKLVLKEWRRVLADRGILRLAVPDFEAIVTAYMELGYDLTMKPGIHDPIYGRMIAGHKYIYHKAIYDFGAMNKLLMECGFTDVRRWDWREVFPNWYDDWSKSHLPHMDFENGLLISLNMEAKKI